MGNAFILNNAWRILSAYVNFT